MTEAPSNSASLLNRLHAAIYRRIASNALVLMGRDGRSFYRVEAMLADHEFVALLRELGTPPPFRHADQCAAVVSKIQECDCHVADTIRRIAAGEAISPSGIKTLEGE